MTKDATTESLRQENADLRQTNTALRDRLFAETTRADLAEKSARDSWRFAKVLLRTGRQGS